MNDTNEITVVSRRSATQARGRARREKLLQTAAELLGEKELEEITFNEVAQRAEIPKGSAYHFYANVMDLYSALTEQIGADLLATLSAPIDSDQVKRWEDVLAELCRRTEQFYDQRPDARQLLIGGKTPPQYKSTDRENDRRIGALLKHQLSQHFKLPSIPNELDVLYYAVSIIDLIYCLSMIRHNHITEEMGEEAVRAGVAYLRTYLPEILPRVES